MSIVFGLLGFFTLLCILFGVLIVNHNGEGLLILLVLAFIVFTGIGIIFNAVEEGKKQATIQIIQFNNPPYVLQKNADGTSEWVMANGQK